MSERPAPTPQDGPPARHAEVAPNAHVRDPPNADAEVGREAFEAFLGARVFCQATGPAEAPGVLALGKPGDGAVPVFSSLEELARFQAARGETEGVDWFATSGEDLLGLIPDGYAILLDPGTAHAALLHPSADRRAE